MKTFTGIALCQSAGFITPGQKLNLMRSVLGISQGKRIPKREALAISLTTGELTIKPSAVHYLFAVLGVCDD